jgi:hypothetical protein
MFFSLPPTPTDGSLAALPAFEEFYASRAHATSVSQRRSRPRPALLIPGLPPEQPEVTSGERRVQVCGFAKGGSKVSSGGNSTGTSFAKYTISTPSSQPSRTQRRSWKGPLGPISRDCASTGIGSYESAGPAAFVSTETSKLAQPHGQRQSTTATLTCSRSSSTPGKSAPSRKLRTLRSSAVSGRGWSGLPGCRLTFFGRSSRATTARRSLRGERSPLSREVGVRWSLSRSHATLKRGEQTADQGVFVLHGVFERFERPCASRLVGYFGSDYFFEFLLPTRLIGYARRVGHALVLRRPRPTDKCPGEPSARRSSCRRGKRVRRWPQCGSVRCVARWRDSIRPHGQAAA